MSGRFGGLASRVTLTNVDNLGGIIQNAYPTSGRVRVDVYVTSTGKRLMGIPYAPKVENEKSLIGRNVRLSRIGGRWVVL